MSLVLNKEDLFNGLQNFTTLLKYFTSMSERHKSSFLDS